jgi:8-oxo-dGTP diphosphatase
MRKIEVAAGILMNNGQVLCLQRGAGKYDYISYKYEFPGGKLESHESPIEALQRELAEEMNIKVPVSELNYYLTISHSYPDFKITMHCFLCNLKNRSFELVEHIAFQWLDPSELEQLDWAAADLPIVSRLMAEKFL